MKKKDDEEEDKEKDKAEDERPQDFFVSELLASSQKDIEDVLQQESETKELKKSWIFRFLEKKGFEFSYDLFSKNQTDVEKMNSFQKNFLGFLLKILRIFITSAFLAVAPEVANLVKLVKKQSSVTPQRADNEETWGNTSQDELEDENIYSTPTNKKSESRTMLVDDKTGNIIDLEDMTGPVNEDYLFRWHSY